MNEQNLDEIIRKEKREYFKNWRAKNADKVKKNSENYWRKRVMQKLQVEKNKDGE